MSSSESSTSVSKTLGITGLCHHAWLCETSVFKTGELKVSQHFSPSTQVALSELRASLVYGTNSRIARAT